MFQNNNMSRACQWTHLLILLLPLFKECLLNVQFWCFQREALILHHLHQSVLQTIVRRSNKGSIFRGSWITFNKRDYCRRLETEGKICCFRVPDKSLVAFLNVAKHRGPEQGSNHTLPVYKSCASFGQRDFYLARCLRYIISVTTVTWLSTAT